MTQFWSDTTKKDHPNMTAVAGASNPIGCKLKPEFQEGFARVRWHQFRADERDALVCSPADLKLTAEGGSGACLSLLASEFPSRIETIAKNPKVGSLLSQNA